MNARIIRTVISAVLLAGAAAPFCAGQAAADKEALAAEYRRLIESDPAAARKARDRYMELVNAPGAKDPFFSFVIGSQWPGTLDEWKYPMRKGKFPQLQACTTMIEAGSDILKIVPSARELERQGIAYDGPGTLDDLVQTPFYTRIFDLPYSVMLLWAHGAENKFLYHKTMTEAQREGLYREFYELTKHLLTQYNNSGKTFLIGNWEGDWLAGGYEMGHKSDIPDDKLQTFRDWLDTRTRAIDDAKASTAHNNVNVYSYLEVNSVRCAKEKNLKRLVNQVLPYSGVDFVSVSSYDAQGFHSWPEPKTADNLRPLVFNSLDYIESMLPPRDVAGKRVFIGEIGYTWEEIAKKQGISIDDAKKEQVRLALIQARVNLEWGTPLWLWWATFSSHEGTFGLVDNATDEPSPLYLELREYFRWAKDFTAAYGASHGGAKPPFAEFRTAALAELDRRIAALETAKP